ncbi:MAG: hypothetical protein AB7O28_17250 [Vicinamibacterales bacterium]
MAADTPRRLTLGGQPLLSASLDALATAERAENGESELVIFGIVEQQPNGAAAEIGIAHLRPGGWDVMATAGADIHDGHVQNGRLTFVLRRRVK